jgi:hypothetical protein
LNISIPTASPFKAQLKKSYCDYYLYTVFRKSFSAEYPKGTYCKGRLLPGYGDFTVRLRMSFPEIPKPDAVKDQKNPRTLPTVITILQKTFRISPFLYTFSTSLLTL